MTQIYGKFVSWTKSVTARHILVVLSTLLLLSAVSIMMLGFVVPKDVVLVEGDNIVTVTTTRIYVEELLAERGVTLRNGDRISAPLHSVLRNNDRIINRRWRKTGNLQLCRHLAGSLFRKWYQSGRAG